MSKLSAIPFAYLASFVLTVILFGACNSTRNWGALLELFGLGVFGIYMCRIGLSPTAFLISFVLQNIVFFITFMRVKARSNWWAIALMAGVAVGALSTTG